MPTPESGLAIRELTARAGSFIVGPVTLDVAAGRVLVILGPSGSGKTTLLTAIAGLRASLAGHVHLAGHDVTRWPPESRRIGMVFQDGALFPHLTVRENIQFGPRAAGLENVATADDLLGRLGITQLADRAPRTLSGGERQRVALARALAIRPRLLLLDEPLSALDQPTREEMRGQLRQLLAQQAIPAIHVTHDRDEALTLADDLAIIASGTIRQVGTADYVATHPVDPVAAKLLGWTELGPGLHQDKHIRTGDLTLPAPEPATGTGPVQLYYRPEDVLLHHADAPISGDSITARIRQMDMTLPLARVILDSTPALHVLALHRDIRQHALQPGAQVKAILPPHAIRIFSGEIARTSSGYDSADV
ncbi:MAG TPA: ABC transporter ATP-binding protein [Streptosporangiaceae bacterium]|nr:ABC transporter ATP-binding protein [Streptosporangiaceae bacterium]